MGKKSRRKRGGAKPPAVSPTGAPWYGPRRVGNMIETSPGVFRDYSLHVSVHAEKTLKKLAEVSNG